MVLRGRNHHCAWFAGVQNEALRGETDNQEVGDPLASRVSADPPGTDLYLHPITYSPSKRTSLSVTRPHILLCLVRILSCLAPTPSPGPMIVHAQKHMLLCTCSGTFMHSHAQVLAYTHTCGGPCPCQAVTPAFIPHPPDSFRPSGVSSNSCFQACYVILHLIPAERKETKPC